MEEGRRLFSTVSFSCLLDLMRGNFPDFERECHAIFNVHSQVGRRRVGCECARELAYAANGLTFT